MSGRGLRWAGLLYAAALLALALALGLRALLPQGGMLEYRLIDMPIRTVWQDLWTGIARDVPVTTQSTLYSVHNYQRQAVYIRKDAGRTQLYADSPTGRLLLDVEESRQLNYPRWSNDGQKLAFDMLSARGGQKHLFILDVRDGTLTELERIPLAGNVAYPSWSPDDERLVYMTMGDFDWELWIAEIATQSTRPLVQMNADALNPSWSPTSENIAFVGGNGGGWDVWLVGSDGTGLRRLTDNPTTDASPVWSPDGTSIAFHSDRARSFQIFIYDLNSGQTRQVTQQSANAMDPLWFP